MRNLKDLMREDIAAAYENGYYVFELMDNETLVQDLLAYSENYELDDRFKMLKIIAELREQHLN